MLPDSYRRERIEVLFDQCSDLPPEQRGRFLDVAVAGDEALKREVEALLASADRADSSGRLERIIAAAFDLPRAPAGPPPGTGERYELLEKLGGGGMGVVYKALDRRSGRPVALKFLSESLAEDPVIRRRFHREARAAAALDHPNIAAIHGVEEQDGRLFLVMPFYGGGTLKQRIAGGALGIAEAVACAIQVAEGLVLAHGWGIIHRDIKPANLVFADDGTLKILDFGIAKIGGEKLTRTGLVLGTLAYMSPEQATGGTVDHRTDLWSLGVVLHEMLAGRPPFSAPSIEQLFRAVRGGETPLVRDTRPEVPERVQDVVSRLLERDPARRYPDARATAAALRG
jgi:serine/threonine protein kinase